MKIAYLIPDGSYSFFREIIGPLEALGFEIQVNKLRGADLIWVGALPMTPDWIDAVQREEAPFILWHWDYFSFVDMTKDRWAKYLELLPLARDVWSCSYETARQLKEIKGIDSYMVPAWINSTSLPLTSYHDYAFYAAGSGGIGKRLDWAEHACGLLKIKLQQARGQSLSRDQYLGLLAGCRVYLMPAFEESNATIPAMEAAACGRPVVLADIPSNREVLGEDGIYFKAWDFGDFKRAIQQAWEDPVGRARQRMLELYDLPVIARRIADRLRCLGLPNSKPGMGDPTNRKLIRPHGWLEYRFSPGKGIEVVNIEVDPVHRSSGIGKALIQELIAKYHGSATAIYGYVQEANLRAIEFYRRCGFTLTHLPRFYGSIGGAYLFHMEIGG